MSAFVWIVPGLIALFAWAILATRRARREDVIDRRETNIAIYRQRRSEIVAVAADDEEARELELELGAQLVTDEDETTPQLSPSDATERLGIKPALLVGGVVSVVAFVLYLLIGDPKADSLKPVRGWVESSDPADWLRAEQLLLDRASFDSDNVDVWFYLGHLRFQQERYAEAADAFRRVNALTRPSENVDLFLAQAIFIANQGTLGDEGREIVNRVLASSGDQAWGLEVLALDAVRSNDLEGAIRYANRILGVVLPAERRAMFVEMQRRLRDRLPDALPAVTATIDLNGHTSYPWLFVTARSTEGGPPIVAVRRALQRGDRSVEVVLDDLVSMMDSNLLSAHAEVDIEARLSSSNHAVDPGALSVRTTPIRVAPAVGERVAIAFPPAEVPEVALAVRIEVDENLNLEADGANTVFVIVRRGLGGPPIAVRKVLVTAFPADVLVTDADVMLPGNSLAGANDISVMARLSQSGDAMPATGDLESDLLRHDDLAKPLTVVLQRRVGE